MSASRGIEPLAGFVRELRPGQRNDGLFWAACRAAEDGLDPAPLAQAAAEIGLPPEQIARTIASARHTVNRARREHEQAASG